VINAIKIINRSTALLKTVQFLGLLPASNHWSDCTKALTNIISERGKLSWPEQAFTHPEARHWRVHLSNYPDMLSLDQYSGTYHLHKVHTPQQRNIVLCINRGQASMAFW